MTGRSDFRRPRVAALTSVVVTALGVGAIVFATGSDAPPDAAALAGSAGGLRAVVGLLPFVLPPVVLIAWLVARREHRLETVATRDAELAGMSWRLDFALAASEVGVWDVDLATDELMWDERTRTLFGVPARYGFYSDADWVGALHPDDRDRAVAAANKAVAGDGRFVSDYRVVHPDGEVRHIRDMAATYRAVDGAHRLVGLIWDVTSDVRRQEELEVRRAEAETATVAKSQFLAAMSHEIRTPMTGVLGMLDLMLEDAMPELQRERATIARASARSLLQILNEVLEFSKLEARGVELRRQDLMPRRVIGDVMDLMAAGAGQKRLALGYDIADAVPEWIVADPMRLQQVLTNLVSNATKFTEAGHVRVRVDYIDGELLVVVEDSGIGIGPEATGRLFEEFYQGDTSLSRRRGGTGLGLAISRRLVDLMGGRISVTSTLGVGSTFGFAIPAPVGTPQPTYESRTRAASGDDAIAPLRILVAEDNATNQYLVRAYLEGSGHSVTTVDNGREAVAAATRGGFDVILMDVQMPEMDGPTAARAIRALPAPAGDVPIVALTANALRGDRDTYIAAGMTDYISKPIDFAALQGALRRAGGGVASGALAAGGPAPGAPSSKMVG